ncbi:hypothetical protein Tsp_04874 [Trichinella spiralis]|uniref:hypothetical protein n=1 Tax=Trichinella spiralis TaxID=6334 RepID=UPI0001EFE1EF|nr:hypothetical protein Tsp_04874 [Trichinella spiralis]
MNLHHPGNCHLYSIEVHSPGRHACEQAHIVLRNASEQWPCKAHPGVSECSGLDHSTGWQGRHSQLVRSGSCTLPSKTVPFTFFTWVRPFSTQYCCLRAAAYWWSQCVAAARGSVPSIPSSKRGLQAVSLEFSNLPPTRRNPFSSTKGSSQLSRLVATTRPYRDNAWNSELKAFIWAIRTHVPSAFQSSAAVISLF